CEVLQQHIDTAVLLRKTFHSMPQHKFHTVLANFAVNKSRLTHENYLKVYDQFLKLNGEIHKKTDNTGLFESSLCYFSQFGYVLYDVTFNLHATEFDNIMTEYERNFTEKGMNIYRCVARKVK
ncbi:MAG: hypothetical protein IIY00_02530, partial [Clostridia bacterium]|nr:hypothetical protein [Clostridia bacterium]